VKKVRSAEGDHLKIFAALQEGFEQLVSPVRKSRSGTMPAIQSGAVSQQYHYERNYLYPAELLADPNPDYCADGCEASLSSCVPVVCDGCSTLLDDLLLKDNGLFKEKAKLKY
jgi:hypothetical protein